MNIDLYLTTCCFYYLGYIDYSCALDSTTFEKIVDANHERDLGLEKCNCIK